MIARNQIEKIYYTYRSIRRRLLPKSLETRAELRDLRRSWSKASSSYLEAYLVEGYQDPILNLQSIGVRQLLISELFGNAFDEIMADELKAAMRINQAAWQEEPQVDRSIKNHEKRINRAFKGVDRTEIEGFAARWESALKQLPATRKVEVLEAACGSANDFRYLVKYGVSRFIDYKGFDLTQVNVETATRLCPEGSFSLGNILEIDAADRSSEIVMVQDIFEHLSPDAYEKALSEVSRVTQKTLILSFFRMGEIPEDEVRPLRRYFATRLSKDAAVRRLEKSFQKVETYHVPRFVEERTGASLPEAVRRANGQYYLFVARR